MFACAITANICYGLGILLRAYTWKVLWSSAPWLLGSLGTVSLDMIIFSQVSSLECQAACMDMLLHAACLLEGCLPSYHAPYPVL